jgi:hypothetical protein
MVEKVKKDERVTHIVEIGMSGVAAQVKHRARMIISPEHAQVPE